MPKLAASALEAFGRELLRAAGAREGEAETVARHCVGANLGRARLPRGHQPPSLHRADEAGAHRPGRGVRDRRGEHDDHRHRRPLGIRVHGVGTGHGIEHREGAPAPGRGGDGAPPGPRRASRRLSADGGGSGHDCVGHGGFRRSPKSVAPSGAARRASARIRSASRCRRTSKAPSSSTSPPRRRRAASWTWPLRGARGCRRAGSSARTAGRAPTRSRSAGAAPCSRSAGRKATRATGSRAMVEIFSASSPVSVRGGAERPPQRRRVHGGLRRGGVSRHRGVQGRGDGVRGLPEGNAPDGRSRKGLLSRGDRAPPREPEAARRDRDPARDVDTTRRPCRRARRQRARVLTLGFLPGREDTWQRGRLDTRGRVD